MFRIGKTGTEKIEQSRRERERAGDINLNNSNYNTFIHSIYKVYDSR